jgi:hypothetical protein
MPDSSQSIISLSLTLWLPPLVKAYAKCYITGELFKIEDWHSCKNTTYFKIHSKSTGKKN